MGDIIVFDEVAKKKLLEGISLLARCVRGSIGINKPYAVLKRLDGTVLSSNHDEIIAEMVQTSESPENLGVEIVRECGRQTVSNTGGGFGLTVAIVDAISRAGMNSILNGYDPFALKKDLEALLSPILSLMDKESVLVKKDEWYAFNWGYASPYFVTNPNLMEAELALPYIYISDKKLKEVYDIIPILENRDNLLIIGEDIGGDGLATLVVNCLKGGLKLLAVNALEVKKVAKRLGVELNSFHKVEKVIVSKESTKIKIAERAFLKAFPSVDRLARISYKHSGKSAKMLPQICENCCENIISIDKASSNLQKDGVTDRSEFSSFCEKCGLDLTDELKSLLTVVFKELSPFLPEPLHIVKEAFANAIVTATSLLTV